MKRTLLTAAAVASLVGSLSAQTPIEIKRDNGTPAGHHTQPGWEETVILSPAGPARVVAAKIYYSGTQAGSDTVHIVGDPAEGAIPATSFVWGYNDLTAPIIVEYDGTPGWRTIDLSERGLRVEGFGRVAIQHRINASGASAVGPFFAVDNSAGSPLASFLYDPISSNTLGFPGVYYRANGDYLVRLVVGYDYPAGNSSMPAPAAALVDRTVSAGLVADAANAPVRASRVSVADWNGDGWDDIAIGSLFFENDADGTFTNVSSRVAINAGATVWGDYDNDGDLDAYAANGGAADAIYRNNGDGTFTNVMATAGIVNERPTVTPIWLDFDRDGKLDLFIANGRTEGPGGEVYFRDAMWRNNGDGTFSDASESSGIAAGEPEQPYDTWGASASDYNGDGYVDIHVATYRLAPDLLFRNDRNGTFSEVAVGAGVHGVATASPQYFGHGIGSEWGDYNNDALPDLAVGNLGHPDWRGMVSNPSLVFRNNGAPSYDFTEVHNDLGIMFFEMNAGVVWLDLDLDGWLDLWHCQYAYNPSGTDGEPTRRSRMYMNGGAEASFRFTDRTWQLGSIIHGAWTAARGDFDRDGRMDLVVASPHSGVRLFTNDVKANGRFLELRVVGSKDAGAPVDGIGTRITVYAGGRLFYRELMGGGSGTTATQNSSLFHFGLGRADAIDSVVVAWANGTATTIAGAQVETNRYYTLTYPGTLASEAVSGIERESAAQWHVRYRDGALTIEGVDGSVEVVDLLGRVVLRETVKGGVELRAELSSGVYLVRAAGGAVQRIVVP
jgi:enediyne biosynthesis protein E4